MAAGMNGQRFAFHGYLPASADGRAQALRRLEADSRAQRCTQIFIETPYRNVAMLGAIVDVLAPATRVCVAADLTSARPSQRATFATGAGATRASTQNVRRSFCCTPTPDSVGSEPGV